MYESERERERECVSSCVYSSVSVCIRTEFLWDSRRRTDRLVESAPIRDRNSHSRRDNSPPPPSLSPPTLNSALLPQAHATHLTNRLSLPKEAVCASIPSRLPASRQATPLPRTHLPLQPLELPARGSIGGNSGGPVGSRGVWVDGKNGADVCGGDRPGLFLRSRFLKMFGSGH